MKAAFFLVLLVCARDPETARFTVDCQSYEAAEPATWSDCQATARHHHETSPAGVRVIASACVRERKGSTEVAKR